ncbi:MAG TPA: hypothetical protein VNL16_05330 [Chloroflexota bacterium]|nr:hypothetical protein [Chloroflexota bacterium]
MSRFGINQRMPRRALLAGIGTVGSIALLSACSSGPPASQATQAPVKPAAAPAQQPAAPANTSSLPTTPTPVPAFTPVPQASGTTKLLVRVHWSGVQFNNFQSVVNKYNSTQGPADKVYITLERFIAGSAGPIATFIADFQAGTQEDVYHLNDAYLADLASRSFFEAPPTEVQNTIKEQYLASAVKTGTWQGNVMGYPTENEPHMMFVDTKLFQDAGLDATKDAPKAWDDIRRLAKQLTQKNSAGQKTQAGFIVHNASGERNIVQRVLFQYLNGAPWVDDSVTPPKFGNNILDAAVNRCYTRAIES